MPKIQLEHKVLKSPNFSFKILDDEEEEGIIEAYVSVFENVDLGGEVIKRGAFEESLKTKLPKGVWAHNWDEPIAKTLEAREDAHGLYIKGKLILSVQKAKEAYELMKEGVIDEFSIGYRVLEDEIIDGIRYLKKVKLYEWSPVLAGMNPATELIGIKTIEVSDDEEEIEEKPYVTEHSCRLRNPDDFQSNSFRRMTRKHEGKEYSVIMGKLKGEDTMTDQAYRYNKEIWTVGSARVHCREHGGTFEPAKSALTELEAEFEKLKDDFEQFKNKVLPLIEERSKGRKPSPEKILRVRQCAKQIDKSIEHILKITK